MKDIDPVWHDKLLVVLHTACSEIRRFSRIGAHQRVYDLADTVEFIPELMLHWREESRESIRGAFRSYQAKYPGSGFDYLSLLDMDEVEFASCYLAVELDPAGNGNMPDIRD
jgi:hypothetical protein